MKTIVVTGGAGSVGREVVMRLASHGHRVRAVDLPNCDWTPLEGMAGVELVKGDIRDCDAIQRATSGADAAIHLAALLPPNSERNREATLAINAGGTANVIAALSATPGVHLILSSSVCVYGDTSTATPPIRVSQPTHASDIYAESKIEAERLVAMSGLPYTILRISGISVPAFLAPPAVWPFTAEQRIEFVCRDDVMAALVACAELDQAPNQTLNIAGGASWRMSGREYVACFNDALGLDPDEGAYSENAGYFDWYDTDASQALLGFQRTSFARFRELFQRAIAEALGA